jgi:hypothetical protein
MARAGPALPSEKTPHQAFFGTRMLYTCHGEWLLGLQGSLEKWLGCKKVTGLNPARTVSKCSWARHQTFSQPFRSRPAWKATDDLLNFQLFSSVQTNGMPGWSGILVKFPGGILTGIPVLSNVDAWHADGEPNDTHLPPLLSKTDSTHLKI